MIERYTLPEIGAIWTEENKFRIWLEIEILACEAQAKLGKIPQEAVTQIREKATFSVERIQEIEAEVHHDVIAFLTNVAEYVGEPARFIHYGMTSSDVLDTALAVQLKQAGELIAQKLEQVISILKAQALKYKDTVMMGRTHGVHAEPITFGFKLLVWYSEMLRNRERLNRAIETISTGKISGAVGTFAHMDPFVEEYVCQHLGLQPAAISTQILQRDRHAEYLSALALIGATLEKIALEIRHLQRTEVLEVEEPFGSRQKGSSAMPHKKNPILSERICGMARLLRGNLVTALENVALWHERDISHSSAERVILPDATIGLYYMLDKTATLLQGMVVHEERMKENLESSKGLYFSQSILLHLVQKGVSREDAYRMVQRNALKVWESSETDLLSELMKDEEVLSYLSKEELQEICNLQNRLKHIEIPFKRLHLL
ncbi:MAG: adenylosuccinate lyase [Calditrichaeota bacterium]|nr:MAG: adenylosuccinate lyase [Calditrichota bacterium]